MTTDITEEDMTDPSVAFAKLIQVVQENQRDTKKGFAQVQQQIEQAFAKAMQAAAPNYGDDLKGIKTALQAIEKKPALAVTMERLEAGIQQAGRQGSAEAVSGLQSAAADYRLAQEREATLLERAEALHWGYVGFATLFVLAIGVAIGFMISGNLAVPIQVPKLVSIATAEDCKAIGGNVGQDKDKRPVCTLSVRP